MEIGCQTLMRSLYLGASAVWQPDTDNSPAAAAANALSFMRVFIAVHLQANVAAHLPPPTVTVERKSNNRNFLTWRT